MKSVNPKLIFEKNKLYSRHPWIGLFELDLGDGSYLRLAAYPEDVDWNGYTWTSFPLWIEPIAENAEGILDDFQVHIANQDRMISSYIENYDLVGKSVTFYIVHKANLDVTDSVLSFDYTITSITTDENVATFTLGHERLLQLEIPRVRYIRDKCRFIFRDSRCRYPNDEFDSITEQSFIIAGDGDKGGGWTAANMAHALIADINKTYEDELALLSDSANGVFNAYDAEFSSPYVYKKFSGSLDAYTECAFVHNNNGQYYGMFFIMDETSTQQWFGIRRGPEHDEVVHTIAGSSSVVATGYHWNYWRLKISGKKAYAYISPDGENWTLLDSRLRTDISNTVRIGFTACNTVVCVAPTQRWEYFRVLEGGLSSCDLTLDGPNGCRAHQNTPNFGGFPSLPSGRLYL